MNSSCVFKDIVRSIFGNRDNLWSGIFPGKFCHQSWPCMYVLCKMWQSAQNHAWTNSATSNVLSCPLTVIV